MAKDDAIHDGRRARKMERTREEILYGAARAMLRSGYAGATMQEIAREVGYTAASLYTYFRSKQEIIEGLVALHAHEFERLLADPTPAGLTFGQRAELLLRRQLELIERQRDIFQVLFSLRPGEVKEGRCDPFEGRVATFTEWLRRNSSRADLAGHTPEDVARFMTGVVYALLHKWITEGISLAERVPVIMDFFLHGVGGARPAAKKRPRLASRRSSS